MSVTLTKSSNNSLVEIERQPSLLDFVDADRKRAESGTSRPHLGLTACCSQCGAVTVDYRHSLSKGLAVVLIRIYRHGSPVRARDLGLNYTQASNLQKLRYWGLIEHLTTEDKRTGHWHITEEGEKFVRATKRLPRHVWTYRAEVLIKNGVPEMEGEPVLITDLVPGYNWRIDWAQEARDHQSSAA